MAAKSETQAQAAAEVEAPVPEVEQPAAEQAPEAEAEQVDEPQAEAGEPDAGEPLPSHVLMKQTDGGSCDAYKADKDGNHRVPVEDVGIMLSHGFEVVGTAA